MGRFDDDGDTAEAVLDETRAVQDDPGAAQGPDPGDGEARGLAGLLGVAPGPGGDGHDRGRELSAGGVPTGEFGEPAVYARGGGLQFPSFRDDDQAGRVGMGADGISGLADEQRPPGPLGEVLGDSAQEALVGGVEHGPASLAVETEHAPDFAGRCLQPRDHLLIAAHGLVETPATAA